MTARTRRCRRRFADWARPPRPTRRQCRAWRCTAASAECCALGACSGGQRQKLGPPHVGAVGSHLDRAAADHEEPGGALHVGIGITHPFEFGRPGRVFADIAQAADGDCAEPDAVLLEPPRKGVFMIDFPSTADPAIGRRNIKHPAARCRSPGEAARAYCQNARADADQQLSPIRHHSLIPDWLDGPARGPPSLTKSYPVKQTVTIRDNLVSLSLCQGEYLESVSAFSLVRLSRTQTLLCKEIVIPGAERSEAARNPGTPASELWI